MGIKIRSNILNFPLQVVKLIPPHLALAVIRQQNRFLAHQWPWRQIRPDVTDPVCSKETPHGLKSVSECSFPLCDELSSFHVMLPDDGGHELLKVIIEPGSKRIVATQLWKFPINSPNDLNIIMFNKLQILFLIFFRVNSKFLINLLVQFTLLIFLPMS